MEGRAREKREKNKKERTAVPSLPNKDTNTFRLDMCPAGASTSFCLTNYTLSPTHTHHSHKHTINQHALRRKRKNGGKEIESNP